MDRTYWRTQTIFKPLFPEIEWNKPERKDQAGKLLIVGGNKLGFLAAAESYEYARGLGVGSVRVLLPDALKKSIPRTLVDVLLAPSNPSGSLSQDALSELQVAARWADGVLLIGDAGRNAETAITYEQFLGGYKGPLTITRDAIDLMKNSFNLIVDRDNTLIVASFAQVQKLFQGMYYPKMLTFSQQLLQVVEALHKFTITYPVSIVTLHKDNIIIASGGEVVTQEWSDPMSLWRGSVATKATSQLLWNPDKVLESVAYSLI